MTDPFVIAYTVKNANGVETSSGTREVDYQGGLTNMSEEFDVEEGKCLTGIYTGITKRGALSFESVLSGSLVAFNVMPKSILKIREEE